ncbi:Ger(x)C family spore germination protein [Evansella sp. AB-P1]|uniref:Ger(x)C family spore germination protein n=1 Tax=Evansella sp. AB-P1 TaxID=3037653 RepID=UPI00241F8CD8|nr:Ger(x)C family spore germination protein [Evansella sp. AB-P1]MDG5789253.1 Ger(x)C family spore germination protein [Evansella sp. AB-P1]
MRRNRIPCLFICIIVFCTGCWDQTFLKDQSLITAIGFDKSEENGQLLMSVAIPIIDKEKINELVYSHVGTSARNARRSIERSTQKTLDPSRNRVIILSEDLAKQDIYSLLDKFYRDPRSSLIAKIAVSEGNVNELLTIPLTNQPEISQFITELIEGVERESLAPVQNLQIICPLMFDPGHDFSVPLLRPGKNTIDSAGLALFDGTKMTGKLDSNEAMVYLMLADELGKITSITQKVHDEKTPDQNNYITFRINELSRKLHVEPKDNGEVATTLDLHVKIAVSEYPVDELQEEEKIDELTSTISENLTTYSENILDKIQAANFDGLGIGRHVYAHHQDFWKNYKWKEIYQNVQFTVNMEVEIVEFGIIN